MIEQFSLRVKLIQDSIGVTLMARCEHHNLPVFLHPFQEWNGIWSDIEPYLNREAIDVYGKLDIWVGLVSLEAVYECLI